MNIHKEQAPFSCPDPKLVEIKSASSEADDRFWQLYGDYRNYNTNEKWIFRMMMVHRFDENFTIKYANTLIKQATVIKGPEIDSTGHLYCTYEAKEIPSIHAERCLDKDINCDDW